MYRCSSGGAGDEEQVHLEILTPPVIQVVKEPQAVVEIGSRVEMGCSVVGFPKPELQWFHNGRELDNKGKGRQYCFWLSVFLSLSLFCLLVIDDLHLISAGFLVCNVFSDVELQARLGWGVA